VELRRFSRAPISRSVLFAPKDDDAFTEGIATDISLGGMFVTSEYPASFGAEITIHLSLSDDAPELVLPAIVRWTRADGMGVQFQMIGARETFAITEVVRRHEEASR
jgi:Tfp pilus assembly protein PilZ